MEQLRNTTIVDETAMKEWTKFYYDVISNKGRKKSVMASSGLALLGLVLLFSDTTGFIKLLSLIFIFISLYLFLLIVFIPRFRLKRPLKNYQSFELSYIFYNDYFTYISNNQLHDLKYDEVTFIYDTEDYLYFYMANQNGGYIIDKVQWDISERLWIKNILSKYSMYYNYENVRKAR